MGANDIVATLRGYNISLRARNRSPNTVEGYLQTVKLFRHFLVAERMHTQVGSTKREHVEAFIANRLEQ